MVYSEEQARCWRLALACSASDSTSSEAPEDITSTCRHMPNQGTTQELGPLPLSHWLEGMPPFEAMLARKHGSAERSEVSELTSACSVAAPPLLNPRSSSAAAGAPRERASGPETVTK